MSEPVWVPLGASVPDLALHDAYAHMREEQPDTTNGGAAGTNTWHTRTLNTIKADGQGIISAFAANRFTLRAGTYYVRARCPGVGVNNSRVRLRNITDTTDVLYGPNIYIAASGPQGGDALLEGRFSIGAAKVFELQQFTQQSRPTDGLGTYSVGEASLPEVYSEIEIWRESPATPIGPLPAIVPPPLVTALPGSPADGQEVILTDSLTAGTYHWLLRYVAARATNKWVFVGGTDLRTFEATSVPVSGSNQGFGPIGAPPVTGRYLCRYLSYVSSPLTHRWQFFPSGTAVTGTRVTSIAGAGTVEQVLDLIAGEQILGGVSGTANSQDRQVTMQPVAIGG